MRASQGGNGNYNPAPDVNQSFEVTAPPVLVAEAGTVQVGSGWQTVNLDNNYTSMVVIATPVLSSATAAPILTRVRNAGSSNFQIRVQNPSDQSLGTHTVHFLVVEEGVYTQAANGIKMEAVKYTSTLTDDNNSWQAQSRAYQNSYSNPVVLGQVMTANDADWSVFWSRGNELSNPPSASDLRVGKHVAEDTDNTRANEVVGYIVLESGSGSMAGVPYSGGLGVDIVQGPGDSATGYNYAVSGLANPNIAVLSAAAMDGVNGGWPVLFGNNEVSNAGIQLVFDEDQIFGHRTQSYH